MVVFSVYLRTKSIRRIQNLPHRVRRWNAWETVDSGDRKHEGRRHHQNHLPHAREPCHWGRGKCISRRESRAGNSYQFVSFFFFLISFFLMLFSLLNFQEYSPRFLLKVINFRGIMIVVFSEVLIMKFVLSRISEFQSRTLPDNGQRSVHPPSRPRGHRRQAPRRFHCHSGRFQTISNT